MIISFKKGAVRIGFQSDYSHVFHSIRDQPFNLQGGGGGIMVFVSFRIFFFRTTRELEYLFLREKKIQNLTLGYVTKTLNQIIFYPPPKSEYFFQQHWESEYFFRKKKT